MAMEMAPVTIATPRTPLHGSREQSLDAIQTQLAKPQPQLEHLSGSGALNSALTAMGLRPTGFHVGQPRAKTTGQQLWLA